MLTQLQLKRLAAAVDGFRAGGNVYVVMRTSGVAPFDVPLVAPEEERQRAIDLATELSKRRKQYHVLGPYMSSEDRDVSNRKDLDQRAIILCHTPTSDPCVPFKLKRTPLLSEIQDVFIELRLRSGGKPIVINCADAHDPEDPRPHLPPDAIFIGMPAFDKFFMPDYFRMYGPRETLNERKRHITRLKQAAEAEGTDYKVHPI